MERCMARLGCIFGRLYAGSRVRAVTRSKLVNWIIKGTTSRQLHFRR